MIPKEVKEAAELLEGWCAEEGRKMREICGPGPAVLLFELLASVCDYFLHVVGARE